MKREIYLTIPRLTIIIVAVGFYLIALLAIIRKQRKPKALPRKKFDSMDSSYSGPERRMHPRRKVSGINIRYKLCDPSNKLQAFKEGTIKDISETGFLLAVPDKLTANNKLEFKLKIPGMSSFMLLQGDIVWVRELEKGIWYYTGIAITEINMEDRKQIARYVLSDHCSVDQSV